MIGYLRTRVRKQPIIALYFKSEHVLNFYNPEAWKKQVIKHLLQQFKHNNFILIFLYEVLQYLS